MNFALNNMSSIFTQNSGYRLKSTEEKMERIQKKQSQIDFFEGKKAELKNMQCNTLDEIAQKLSDIIDCPIISLEDVLYEV